MKSKAGSMFRSLVNKSKSYFKAKEPEDQDLSGEDEDLIVIGKHKGVGSAKTQLGNIAELAGKSILKEDKYINEY